MLLTNTRIQVLLHHRKSCRHKRDAHWFNERTHRGTTIDAFGVNLAWIVIYSVLASASHTKMQVHHGQLQFCASRNTDASGDQRELLKAVASLLSTDNDTSPPQFEAFDTCQRVSLFLFMANDLGDYPRGSAPSECKLSILNPSVSLITRRCL